MNKYLISFLSLFLLTCESPERVWDNPYDPEAISTVWMPQNLTLLRTSVNELVMSWECNIENIDGFKIDRKINKNQKNI